MCSTCGCGSDEVRVSGVEDSAASHSHNQPHDQPHEHPHDHPHDHDHSEDRTHTIELETAVLARNDHLAGHNRRWLQERDIRTLNLMSSPGAGKTTLLERTIALTERNVSVIEGDQETLFDAERIRAAGARAVQVNTGAGCHLDGSMVGRALEELQPEPGSVLFIENVGNLVCPALFDLGESARVVVISVPEGDDKPLKYPHMFSAADVVVVNKIDLLPYVDFDVARFTADARKLNPDVTVLPVSARTGEGLDAWLTWLT
ncbi:MAG: hydrogenase nickel incorporation protein HypB [Nocardioides sp.]|nr:hydrogenase nickel incorporation protein HypB [Nocardioides sp.]